MKAHGFFGADKAASNPPALVSAYAVHGGLRFRPASSGAQDEVFLKRFSLKPSRVSGKSESSVLLQLQPWAQPLCSDRETPASHVCPRKAIPVPHPLPTPREVSAGSPELCSPFSFLPGEKKKPFPQDFLTQEVSPGCKVTKPRGLVSGRKPRLLPPLRPGAASEHFSRGKKDNKIQVARGSRREVTCSAAGGRLRHQTRPGLVVGTRFV